MKLKLKNYEAVEYHKEIARQQRQAYNFQRESVMELKDKLMIVLDYKQKIAVGMGARQVNSEFRNQKELVCLGK